MTPNRKIIVNGYKIEEFYWNGYYTCYVNNKLVDITYEKAVIKYSNLR